MAWDDDLTQEQRIVASAHDGHARILAGPGTGKTFTLKARVQYLIETFDVTPSRILIVTFTRKAVTELRDRILPCIPESVEPPRISTLHGFALRQLLRNSNLVETLPAPLRIADDWEEDAIIIPDLQRLLKKNKKDIRAALDAMSSNWDTLTDAELNVDPQFITAWRRIRNVYGFTLRAEMVYRLKRAMEQHDKFQLEGQFRHVIVDEFQDLNACDLAVVQALSSLGASVFCAGDDDQSIYGFRKASPAGIRAFVGTYPDAEDHKMTLCKRCDSEILAAAEYVANQDLDREMKDLVAENHGGLVRIFAASDQYTEAKMITTVCQRLHAAGYEYSAIAILVHSDYHGRFSQPIVDTLSEGSVPVSEHRIANPLSEENTRRLYALAQLAVSADDSLAVRTLLQLTPGIGDSCIETLESLAVKRGDRYSNTARAVAEDVSLLANVGSRVAAAWKNIEAAVHKLEKVVAPSEEDGLISDELRNSLFEAALVLGLSTHAVDDLIQLVSETESASLTDLLAKTSTVGDRFEPQLSKDSVNIMTMHQAKGLTFDCVLIPGLEDELIPGNYDDPEQEGDQRRLLYVSMTRARHALMLFYATRRTGAQAHSGRGPTTKDRNLTRFLSDYKFKKD